MSENSCSYTRIFVHMRIHMAIPLSLCINIHKKQVIRNFAPRDSYAWTILPELICHPLSPSPDLFTGFISIHHLQETSQTMKGVQPGITIYLKLKNKTNNPRHLEPSSLALAELQNHIILVLVPCSSLSCPSYCISHCLPVSCLKLAPNRKLKGLFACEYNDG